MKRACAPLAALAVLIVLAARTAAQVPLAAETFDAAWTIIRDTHFDKTMNGRNWDAVRAELKPRAAAAKSEAELRAVIGEMLAQLGLSHFALIPSSADMPAGIHGRGGEGTADPGLDVRLIGRDLVVTKVTRDAAAAVRPGCSRHARRTSRLALARTHLPTGSARRGLARRRLRAPPAPAG